MYYAFKFEMILIKIILDKINIFFFIYLYSFVIYKVYSLTLMLHDRYTECLTILLLYVLEEKNVHKNS